MDDTNQQLMEAFDGRVERRNDRRDFFKAALGAAAVAGAGVGALTIGTSVLAQAAPSDADVLNFALNLEYLEAQFYSYAVTGAGLPEGYLDGTTPRGTITPGRQVPFQDPLVRSYAQEIYQDEVAHVAFLRSQLAGVRVSMPSIDIGVSPTGAFSKAAQAAGLVPAGTAFNPYADDNSFLLGSFIFEDVGVTAYKGAAPLLTNKTYIEAAAGILAVEAYHASVIRTTLYAKGIATPSSNLIQATEAISNARDTLDGSPAIDLVRGVGPDDDQGVMGMNTANGTASNIAPLNANGLAYSRTTGQVLNIVYLTSAQAMMGGFFPNGVNGAIKTSAASG